MIDKMFPIDLLPSPSTHPRTLLVLFRSLRPPLHVCATKNKALGFGSHSTVLGRGDVFGWQELCEYRVRWLAEECLLVRVLLRQHQYIPHPRSSALHIDVPSGWLDFSQQTLLKQTSVAAEKFNFGNSLITQ